MFDIDDVLGMLDELKERYQKMREDGDHDMRTVIYHLEMLIEGITEVVND